MWARGVSAPRQVVPGRTYLLDRRTTRRFFLLRPDPDGEMQRVFLYVLAVCAAKFGVLVHGLVQMSSHYHLVVTDVEGVMPDFLRELNRLLALTTKAHRRWPEELFEPAPISWTPQRAVGDRREARVRDREPGGGVGGAHGAQVAGGDRAGGGLGRKVFRVPRPEGYFDPNNPQWPEEAELRVVLPEQLVDELGEGRAREAVALQVAEKERAARAEAQREHKAFVGAKRVMQAAITVRGTNREEHGVRAPTFAAAGDDDAAKQAVTELKEFRASYREQLERWKEGDRDVTFPHGT